MDVMVVQDHKTIHQNDESNFLASKVPRKNNRIQQSGSNHLHISPFFRFSPPSKLYQKFIVTPEYNPLPLKL